MLRLSSTSHQPALSEARFLRPAFFTGAEGSLLPPRTNSCASRINIHQQNVLYSPHEVNPK